MRTLLPAIAQAAFVLVGVEAGVIVVSRGSRLSWLAVGILTGVFGMAVGWLVNARTHNLTMGAWAETWTTELLRRQRGWLVIDDLAMTGYNIDHVAIAPSAVLVVETKYYGPTQSAWPPVWHASNVAQATRNAGIVARLLRSELPTGTPVLPVLMLWGVGVPSDLTFHRDGEAWVVAGSEASEFLQPRRACSISPDLAANFYVRLRGHQETALSR